MGNTRANNVIRLDPNTGAVLEEFIPAGSGGLFSPDTTLLGPDANADGQQDLYIASGNLPATSSEVGSSAVLRFDARTGRFIDRFVADNPQTPIDETGELNRPYGMAFGPDGSSLASEVL